MKDYEMQFLWPLRMKINCGVSRNASLLKIKLSSTLRFTNSKVKLWNHFGRPSLCLLFTITPSSPNGNFSPLSFPLAWRIQKEMAEWQFIGDRNQASALAKAVISKWTLQAIKHVVHEQLGMGAWQWWFDLSASRDTASWMIMDQKREQNWWPKIVIERNDISVHWRTIWKSKVSWMRRVAVLSDHNLNVPGVQLSLIYILEGSKDIWLLGD